MRSSTRPRRMCGHASKASGFVAVLPPSLSSVFREGRLRPASGDAEWASWISEGVSQVGGLYGWVSVLQTSARSESWEKENQS